MAVCTYNVITTGQRCSQGKTQRNIIQISADRLPLYRVVCMLEQVGGFLVDEAVGVLVGGMG